jgi:zona occludens toxin (predicted ATPase)
MWQTYGDSMSDKKFLVKSSLIKLSFRKFVGQISFEFISMFIIIMLAFLFFFAIYSEFNALTHQIAQKDKAKAVASDIADAVNAILPSENTSVTIQISHGYSIFAGVRSIIAQDYSNFTGSAPILTDNLNISLPENATNLTISKIQGKVYINGS